MSKSCPPETGSAGGGIFEGVRTASGCVMTLDGAALPLRLDVRRHSPTGFEWGHDGSGLAQPVLAMLLAAGADPDLAGRRYQAFKHGMVARLQHTGWTATTAAVQGWLQRGDADRLTEHLAEALRPTGALGSRKSGGFAGPGMRR